MAASSRVEAMTARRAAVSEISRGWAGESRRDVSGGPGGGAGQFDSWRTRAGEAAPQHPQHPQDRPGDLTHGGTAPKDNW